MTRCLLLLLVLMPPLLSATTWSDVQVDDPILVGETCAVHEPMSYGGYIYSWPSKYDLVFWPFTDHGGIWFCEKSGFTAFINDFDGMSEQEITNIRDYLAANPAPDDSIQSKLRLLENIYELRNTDKAFDNRLLRTLARWYQDLNEIELANEYRARALADMGSLLAEALEKRQKLGYLYVAASYSRQLGDIAGSDSYLRQFEDMAQSVTDEESQDMVVYLTKLVSTITDIKPGGMIDPEVESNQ